MTAHDKDGLELVERLTALRAEGAATPVKPKDLSATMGDARAPAGSGAENGKGPLRPRSL